MDPDDFLQMAEGAALLKVMFDSLMAAGFTQEQAISMCVQMCAQEAKEALGDT